MLVTRLRLRDFRSYASADVALGERLSVVHGPNGAGKTNLLEAIYFGCTGRSPRTSRERDLVRFGAEATRVAIATTSDEGAHLLEVGLEREGSKRLRVDGAPAQTLVGSPARPLVTVFMPDRLELLKGPPSVRRAHLDQLVAALWPARADAAPSYSRVLGQRNALLARILAGSSSP